MTGEDVAQGRAVEAAGAYAAEQGWRTDEYDVASVLQEHGRYFVRFEGRSRRPGDHFTVEVDAESGRVANLIPGR
jgi:hypothetical protein